MGGIPISRINTKRKFEEGGEVGKVNFCNYLFVFCVAHKEIKYI